MRSRGRRGIMLETCLCEWGYDLGMVHTSVDSRFIYLALVASGRNIIIFMLIDSVTLELSRSHGS
jgi:hypothetical protein